MSFLIKVFKTLNSILPQCGINFDLEDTDKVLRIVAEHPTQIETLVSYIKKEGFSITLLD